MSNRLVINIYNDNDERLFNIFYQDCSSTDAVIAKVNEIIENYAKNLNKRHYRNYTKAFINALYSMGASLDIEESSNPETIQAVNDKMAKLLGKTYRFVWRNDPYKGLIAVTEESIEYNEMCASTVVNMCLAENGRLSVCMFWGCDLITCESYFHTSNLEKFEELDAFADIITAYRRSNKNDEEIKSLVHSLEKFNLGLCDCNDFVAPLNDSLIWYNPKEKVYETENFRFDLNQYSNDSVYYLSLWEINDSTMPFIDLTVCQTFG